nr:winged helix-turn-helix transcriptional regulator [uncultured Capnocytophaga sp.]
MCKLLSITAFRVVENISQKELAQSIGITPNGIKYHIKNMTKLRIIFRLQLFG